ncbi:hypothetical protein BS17DRAFT_454871 [Gyrodon lividus]|nr:hypothetical protein BS17DRAFT_454871 [Gyrodon lividus]
MTLAINLPVFSRSITSAKVAATFGQTPQAAYLDGTYLQFDEIVIVVHMGPTSSVPFINHDKRGLKLLQSSRSSEYRCDGCLGCQFGRSCTARLILFKQAHTKLYISHREPH